MPTETPKHETDDARALYRNGKMTRAGMVRVIEAGGSVLHQGTHYGKVDDLPDEATLTEGDVAASAAATAAIDAQIANLTSQRSTIAGTHARNVEAEARKAAEPDKPAMPPATTPPSARK